eukprot:2700699-Rhodomonas_salina.1
MSSSLSPSRPSHAEDEGPSPGRAGGERQVSHRVRASAGSGGGPRMRASAECWEVWSRERGWGVEQGERMGCRAGREDG